MNKQSAHHPEASGSASPGRAGRGFYVQAVLLFAGILLLAGAVYAVLYSMQQSQRERNDALRQQIVPLDKQIAALVHERRKLRQIADISHQPGRAAGGKHLPPLKPGSRPARQAANIGLLDFMMQQVPPGVQFISAELDSGELRLKLATASPADIEALADAAQASPYLKDIVLTSGAARMQDGKRLQEFRLLAVNGYFPDKSVHAGKPLHARKKQAARTDEKPRPTPELEEKLRAARQEASERQRAAIERQRDERLRQREVEQAEARHEAIRDTALVVIFGTAILLFARWLRCRSARKSAASSLSQRMLDRFNVCNPRDASSWGRLPRYAVLAELMLLAGLIAYITLDTPRQELEALQRQDMARTAELEKKRQKVEQLHKALESLRAKSLPAGGKQASEQRTEKEDRNTSGQQPCCEAPVTAAAMQHAVHMLARSARLSVLREEALAPMAGKDGLMETHLVVELAGKRSALGSFAVRLGKLPGMVVVRHLDFKPAPASEMGKRDPALHITAELVAHGAKPAEGDAHAAADAQPAAADTRHGGKR